MHYGDCFFASPVCILLLVVRLTRCLIGSECLLLKANLVCNNKLKDSYLMIIQKGSVI